MASKSILLVEDNPDDEALALRAFRASNVLNQVDVCRDGEEALEYMFAVGRYAHRNVNELPQVVLLDIQLPKLDGLEVLRRLREDKRTCLQPIVLLTSSQEERDVIEGYSRGANSYIQKPVNFDQFVEAVKQLGLYWLVLNRVPGY